MSTCAWDNAPVISTAHLLDHAMRSHGNYHDGPVGISGSLGWTTHFRDPSFLLVDRFGGDRLRTQYIGRPWPRRLRALEVHLVTSISRAVSRKPFRNDQKSNSRPIRSPIPAVARSMQASPSTVGEYIRRANTAGLSWPLYPQRLGSRQPALSRHEQSGFRAARLRDASPSRLDRPSRTHRDRHCTGVFWVAMVREDTFSGTMSSCSLTTSAKRSSSTP